MKSTQFVAEPSRYLIVVMYLILLVLNLNYDCAKTMNKHVFTFPMTITLGTKEGIHGQNISSFVNELHS